MSSVASFACFDCASYIFSGAIDFFLSLDIPVNTSLRCIRNDDVVIFTSLPIRKIGLSIQSAI